MAESSPNPAVSSAPEYDTFDDYLKLAVKEYYQRGWKARRATLIALVIASGQSLSIAKDAVSGERGLKGVAIGAASVVALRLGLRYLLGGPLGILVTAATVASLIAYLIKNQKEISARLGRMRERVAEEKIKFEELQTGYRANRYDAKERNLMVDGQLHRFLDSLDQG